MVAGRCVKIKKSGSLKCVRRKRNTGRGQKAKKPEAGASGCEQKLGREASLEESPGH